MNYEYKSIAFDAIVSISDNHEEVTRLYDEILNFHSKDGWEFYTMDEIRTHKPRGCFTEPELNTLKIAIFRRKL